MSEFNKHGEHANDMDYIIELQESISWLEKMCGNTNSALAVYRTYLERNGYGIQLLDIDKELQALEIEPPKFHLISAAPDMYEALKSIKAHMFLGDIFDRPIALKSIEKVITETLLKAEGKEQ